MTDFHAQLERQLVDAGRRRSERGRLRGAATGRGRLVAAACAVALALAAGGVVVPGLMHRSGPAADGGAEPQPTPPSGSRPLRGVGVAVLNGTTRAGIARAVAELLERRGATIYEIANSSFQSVADTIVAYAAGAEAPARQVAAVLGVDDVEPLARRPPATSTAATVIVVAGRDRIAP